MIPTNLRKTFDVLEHPGNKGKFIVYDTKDTGSYYVWICDENTAQKMAQAMSSGNYLAIQHVFDRALQHQQQTGHFQSWMADIQAAMSTKPMLGDVGVPEPVAAFNMPTFTESYDDQHDEYDIYRDDVSSRIATVSADSYELLNELFVAQGEQETFDALAAIHAGPSAPGYLTSEGICFMDELAEWLKNTSPCIAAVEAEAEAEMFGNRIVKDRGFVTDTIDPNVDVMDEVRKACQGIK